MIERRPRPNRRFPGRMVLRRAVVLMSLVALVTPAAIAGLAVFAPPAAAAQGDISTFAGDGNPGFSGDGNLATSSDLQSPTGIAIDAHGNELIADRDNERIRIVANSATNPGYPCGGCTWTVGNMYTIAGTTTFGYNGDGIDATTAKLRGPADVAVDGSGNVLIADQANSRIRVVAVAPSNPGYPLSGCTGTCTWTDGDIFTIAGNGTTGYNNDNDLATADELSSPGNVAVDALGNLLIGDTVNGRIRLVAISPSNPGYSLGGHNCPCTWTEQDIYTVAGSSVSGSFGGDGSPAAGAGANDDTAARLNDPHGVTTDPEGNILFADESNHRIRVVADSASNPGYLCGGCTWTIGDIYTIAGNGTGGYTGGDGVIATGGEVDFPTDVAVDSSGNVLIADTFNERIRIVAVSASVPDYGLFGCAGTCTWTDHDIYSIAGTGTGGDNNDGPAATTQINLPSDLAFDAQGNVMFADEGNNIARELQVAPDTSFSVPANVGGPNGFQTPVTVTQSVSLSATGLWSELPGLAFPRTADGVPPVSNFAAFLLPSANAFSLIGRIGTSGPWTEVGSGPTTLNGSGTLYLAMNDSAGDYGDNSGSMTVTVNGLVTMTAAYDTPGPVNGSGAIGWGGTFTNGGSTSLTNAHIWADPANELLPAQTTVPTWQLLDTGSNPVGSPTACTTVVTSTPLFDCTVPQIDPGFSVQVGAEIEAQGIKPVTVTDSFFLEHTDQTGGCYQGCVDSMAPQNSQRIDGLLLFVNAPASVIDGFPLSVSSLYENQGITPSESISGITYQIVSDLGTSSNPPSGCNIVNHTPLGTGATLTCPTPVFLLAGLPGPPLQFFDTDTTGLAGQTIHFAMTANSPDLGGDTYTDTASVFVTPHANVTVPATTPPLAPQVTAGSDAGWTVPIANNTTVVAQNVTVTLDGTATFQSNTSGLTFDTTAINTSLGLAGSANTCAPGAGTSIVCSLPSGIPAHSTLLFTVFVRTNGLTPGTTIDATINTAADNAPPSSGTLGTTTVSSTCITNCTVGVAAPGDPFASSPADTANLTQQVLVLSSNTPGGTLPPLPVTLQSLPTGTPAVPTDPHLCPTATGQSHCEGDISAVTAQLGTYNNALNPIRVTIISHWGTALPAGQMLMEKNTGGDPIFLTTCVVDPITHAFNVPCKLPELVRGSAAGNNITTYDTILFTGLDIHFARRQGPGTGTRTAPPAAPTALTATAGVGKAVLKWKAPTVTNGAGVTGYVVTVLLAGKVVKTVTYASALVTETVTGLKKGGSYTFKVAAKNVAGAGAASAVSKAVIAK